MLHFHYWISWIEDWRNIAWQFSCLMLYKLLCWFKRFVELICCHGNFAGVPGDQCLGVRLQTVTGAKYYCKLKGECLPLTPKSTLVWAGYVCCIYWYTCVYMQVFVCVFFTDEVLCSYSHWISTNVIVSP